MGIVNNESIEIVQKQININRKEHRIHEEYSQIQKTQCKFR